LNETITKFGRRDSLSSEKPIQLKHDMIWKKMQQINLFYILIGKHEACKFLRNIKFLCHEYEEEPLENVVSGLKQFLEFSSEKKNEDNNQFGKLHGN
jgi:hypothetical protein